WQQLSGQGTLTGTDFHDVVACAWGDGIDDAADDVLVMQKILAEALAGLMLKTVLLQTLLCRLIVPGAAPVRVIHRLGIPCAALCRVLCAMILATSMASMRLPGLAVPVPARSRAVP